jgi:hypothetical protein
MTENTKKEQSQISMELLQTINIKISNQRNSAHNRIAELEIIIESLQRENKKLTATIEGEKLFKENNKDKK